MKNIERKIILKKLNSYVVVVVVERNHVGKQANLRAVVRDQYKITDVAAGEFCVKALRRQPTRDKGALGKSTQV